MSRILACMCPRYSRVRDDYREVRTDRVRLIIRMS
jgi:hypothetical protein